MKFTSLSVKQCAEWLDRSDTDFVYDPRLKEFVYWNSRSAAKKSKASISLALEKFFANNPNPGSEGKSTKAGQAEKDVLLIVKIASSQELNLRLIHCGNSESKHVYAGFLIYSGAIIQNANGGSRSKPGQEVTVDLTETVLP